MHARRRNHRPHSHAHVESHTEHAPLRAKETARLNAPVRLVVTHYRKRLVADCDGLSIKAALDAIARTGVIADDSPKHIVEVVNRQAQSSTEKTVFRFEEIKGE